jgi:hypothetical protein
MLFENEVIAGYESAAHRPPATYEQPLNTKPLIAGTIRAADAGAEDRRVDSIVDPFRFCGQKLRVECGSHRRTRGDHGSRYRLIRTLKYGALERSRLAGCFSCPTGHRDYPPCGEQCQRRGRHALRGPLRPFLVPLMVESLGLCQPAVGGVRTSRVASFPAARSRPGSRKVLGQSSVACCTQPLIEGSPQLRSTALGRQVPVLEPPARLPLAGVLAGTTPAILQHLRPPDAATSGTQGTDVRGSVTTRWKSQGDSQ